MFSLRTAGKFPRGTQVRQVRIAFQVPNIYDYITKLCRQQKPYKITKMQIIATWEKAKPDTENIISRLQDFK
jgi:hypothetical protein